MFFYEYYESFKITYFEEHLRTVVSESRIHFTDKILICDKQRKLSIFPSESRIGRRLIIMCKEAALSKGFLRKKCSENMQQTYRRTPMPNCDFN